MSCRHVRDGSRELLQLHKLRYRAGDDRFRGKHNRVHNIERVPAPVQRLLRNVALLPAGKSAGLYPSDMCQTDIFLRFVVLFVSWTREGIPCPFELKFFELGGGRKVVPQVRGAGQR